MATRTLPTTNEAYVPIGIQEPILRSDSREISLLVADENLSLTYASRAAGERVTDPHVHQHTEAFYVLEGELTFEVGAERETITIGAGGFVAAPPGVAHSLRHRRRPPGTLAHHPRQRRRLRRVHARHPRRGQGRVGHRTGPSRRRPPRRPRDRQSPVVRAAFFLRDSTSLSPTRRGWFPRGRGRVEAEAGRWKPHGSPAPRRRSLLAALVVTSVLAGATAVTAGYAASSVGSDQRIGQQPPWTFAAGGGRGEITGQPSSGVRGGPHRDCRERQRDRRKLEAQRHLPRPLWRSKASQTATTTTSASSLPGATCAGGDVDCLERVGANLYDAVTSHLGGAYDLSGALRRLSPR